MSLTKQGLKRIYFTLVLLISVAKLSNGQSIEDLFKLLPASYTPELSLSGKDSLLQFNIYNLPGGDSLDNQIVHLSEKNNDYIQVNYFYTTGQAGFIRIELRKFYKKNGDFIVVYSKYGGMNRAFDQHSLLTFDYNAGKLSLNKNLGLPETTSQSLFLKTNFADSKSRIFSTGYNLYPDRGNSVEYRIYPQSNEENNLIKREIIIYTWDGNKFIQAIEK